MKVVIGGDQDGGDLFKFHFHIVLDVVAAVLVDCEVVHVFFISLFIGYNVIIAHTTHIVNYNNTFYTKNTVT